ncbi:HPr family phosphocarrier protein [Alicyclobacillus fodiniaquatilis]|uniref:Phosphocarrier protein HPr n=1 Tax=Alicyclobacillus fodiniaquatilis TaxID=1661150 RepID=A0ABW4JLK7_9BACL
MERQVTLGNASGLHARPASVFVAEAGKFASDVLIEVEGKRINAKSILGLLSLGVSKGQTLTIITEGADAEEALSALCQLVESGLGE